MTTLVKSYHQKSLFDRRRWLVQTEWSDIQYYQ